ncbi:MAG: hypothetical protein BAJALOKI1v1_1360004 [Promethearchaeota archaeon]|nr:MAG: hypothetical protein BAJALOKI1v1_1360004 [Candidatus Lokiarchaeota archaeon]
MEEIDWEDIKEKLSKALKLEKDVNTLTIKLTIIESNIKDNEMVGGMLKSEEEMKQSLQRFMGQEKPLDLEVDINQEEKSILLAMKSEEDFKKVYDLLNELFFGDYLKKMFEAMMGAFGNMFKSD